MSLTKLKSSMCSFAVVRLVGWFLLPSINKKSLGTEYLTDDHFEILMTKSKGVLKIINCIMFYGTPARQ